MLAMGISTSGQTGNNAQKNWYDMMLDPQANFFDTQKAFYDFWEGKTAKKGEGYSVFKRWEYYWSSRVDENGNFLGNYQNGIAVAWDFGDHISATGYLYQGETEDYRINVAPVPVPAAVWLLGSGLLGLIGVRRKKKS